MNGITVTLDINSALVLAGILEVRLEHLNEITGAEIEKKRVLRNVCDQLNAQLFPHEHNLASNSKVNCSFCGKSQEKVEKILSGNNSYICNECVNLCLEVLLDEKIELPALKNIPKENNIQILDKILENVEAIKNHCFNKYDETHR